MKRICLNMIVKNERHVIERCLASVKPFIDTWVIVDTGSTDGTQEAIRAFLSDIPGALYERPWVDFATNRNEALQLAEGKGDFFLFIDADDILVPEPGFALPPLIHHLYWIDNPDRKNSVSVAKILLIDASIPWRWEGVLHERLLPGAPIRETLLERIHLLYMHDGARGSNPNLLQNDIDVLLRALEKEPDNGRYLFYLGQSYRGAGQLEKALEAYEKRVRLGGNEEEIYYSLFNIAKLSESLPFPYSTVVSRYQSAFEFRPSRIEALYFLALYALAKGVPSLAYESIQKAMQVPPSSDFCFVSKWIGEWALPLPLAEAAHKLGRFAEAKKSIDAFFSNPKLPASAAAAAKNYIWKHPQLRHYVPQLGCV